MELGCAGGKVQPGSGDPERCSGRSKRSLCLSTRSLRRLACQSAGRLSALFFHQRPWHRVGWVGGGCGRRGEQKGRLIIPLMWRFSMGSRVLFSFIHVLTCRH